MKKVLAVILTFVIVITGLYLVKPNAAVANAESAVPDISWYNDKESEFVLTTRAQFYGIAQLVNVEGKTFAEKTIKLGTNISLNDNIDVDAWETTAPEYKWTAIGTETNKFAGTFDGQGYCISGLYMSTGAPNAGLFGFTSDTSSFKNFQLVNSYISTNGRDNAGIIANGTFELMEGVYTNAVFKASSNVSGFVGYLLPRGTEQYTQANVTFKNCWFDGTAVATAAGGTRAGGFIGQISGTNGIAFYNCLSTGKCQAVTRAGGFIGWKSAQAWNEFHNCLSLCELIATSTDPEYLDLYGAYYGQYSCGSIKHVTMDHAYCVVKVAGKYDSTDTLESEEHIKTLDYLKTTDVATLFPLLAGETHSPWEKVEGSTPTLKGLDPSIVPVEMLGIKLQQIGGTGNTMRLITSVDNLGYSEVGFIVNNGSATKKMSTRVVFEKIKSSVDGTSYNFSPKLISNSSEYFATVKFDVANVNNTYTVQAYVITRTGEEIRGREIRSFQYSDGSAENYVNLLVPGELSGELEATYGTNATATESQADSVSILGTNDGYTSVKVDLAGSATVSGLKSATKFIFTKNGEPVATGIYRNYYTTHKTATTTANADTSWYDVAPDATEFVVATTADLYGLASIVNNTTDIFTGDCITLVKNITFNKGEAKTSLETSGLPTWTSQEGTTTYSWTPIGFSWDARFDGTFDGDDNEISGIYLENTSASIRSGLFGYAGSNCRLKNFKFVNSYISSSQQYTGGITGLSYASEYENIYTDVIVVSQAYYTGGFVGSFGVNGLGPQRFTNCWFDGELFVRKGQPYSGVFVGILAGNNAEIKYANCLFTGHAGGTKSDESLYLHTGNFFATLLGYAGGSGNVITADNCLILGTMTTDAAGLRGSIIGNVGSATGTLTNVYEATNMTANVIHIQNGTNANVTYNSAGRVEKSTLEDADLTTKMPSAATEGTDWVYAADNTLMPKTFLSWYDSKTAYFIYTAEDLRKFAQESQTNDFSGKAVVLCNDIDLNQEGGWQPIGSDSAPFAGIFDGREHTISGLYLKSNAIYVGLFGLTAEGSEIRNLRLVDSYIEQTFTSHPWSHFTGSVVASHAAKLSNVYSNATVVGTCHYTGGLVGRWNGTEDTISDCWFDGRMLLADNIKYIGGIVGLQDKGKLSFNNVLNTGYIQETITIDEAMFIGGIVGASGPLETAPGAGTYFESVVSAGTYAIPYGNRQIGSIAGYLLNGTVDSPSSYTFNNVFATREYSKTHGKGDGYRSISGQVIQTADKDRFIGYHAQSVKDLINNTVVTGQKLDFTNDWSLRTKGVPIPTALADMVEKQTLVTDGTAATFTTELGLDVLGGNFASAAVEGAGDYLLKCAGDQTKYNNYLKKLEELGFTKYVNNAGTQMEADGVCAATYYKEASENKGEWVLHITLVAKESQVYVVINTDTDSLADTLINKGEQNTAGEITLSMVEDKVGATITGSCFAFQLPNGHFIINDGNTPSGAGTVLKDYLVSIVGEGNPIYIDAWTLTHFHNDHLGALVDMANDATLRENVYVKAVYLNEISPYETTNHSAVSFTDLAMQAIKRLTKSPTDATSPELIQVHMGQRYYFCGLTMDIINTPDQLLGVSWNGDSGTNHIPDTFNTSSTNFVFTLNNGKRILIGGDTTMIGMKYIMAAYGSNNQSLANINVFSAYHHGKNVISEWTPTTNNSSAGIGNQIYAIGYNTWADFLLKNSNNGSGFKFDVVLFTDLMKYKTTLQNGVYTAYDGGIVYPWNIGVMNQYYADNSKLHFTLGYDDSVSKTEAERHGTVRLTFDTNGAISYEVFDSVSK